MANCPECGARMLHYENPSRELCPRVAKHGLRPSTGKPQKHHRPVTDGRKKKKNDGKS